MNTKPTVLLTGGAGYIGSHTAVVLQQAGYSVIILDNFCNSSPQAIPAIEKISGQPVPVVNGDLRDANALDQLFSNHPIGAVIHLAGLKAVGESSSHPLRYYDNNVCGTVTLLQAMQRHGVHQLVFSSSATVYGTPQFLPYTESHPTAPVNPYGQTKLHIEQMLQDLSRSDPRWRFAVLRYFNPVGAHESGDLGENPRGVPNNLMPYLMQVAAGIRSHLVVHGKDYDTLDGTGVRDYLHVCDLAEGHVAALKFLSHSTISPVQSQEDQAAMGQGVCEVFNLGTGTGYSVLQMHHAFEQTTGCQVPYQIGARRAGDLPAFWADASKANTVLSWQAKRDIASMCASTWRWQQQHPNGFDAKVTP